MIYHIDLSKNPCFSLLYYIFFISTIFVGGYFSGESSGAAVKEAILDYCLNVSIFIDFYKKMIIIDSFVRKCFIFKIFNTENIILINELFKVEETNLMFISIFVQIYFYFVRLKHQ